MSRPINPEPSKRQPEPKPAIETDDEFAEVDAIEVEKRVNVWWRPAPKKQQPTGYGAVSYFYFPDSGA
jgi:hypothetical protein